MILIYPPVAKPSEPPAGLAKLSGTLNRHGIKHSVLDANLEALSSTIGNAEQRTVSPTDRWTRRAVQNVSKNFDALRQWQTYKNVDRYKRAVTDLNHAVEMSIDGSVTLGLANYRDRELSPLRSRDLLRTAERPEGNPFHPYFSKRLSDIVKKDSPQVAGFSLNYLSQALCTFAMIGYVRQNFPGMKVVLGGGLVTSWMKGPQWKNPFAGLVDLLISGPGEKQVLSLMGIQQPEETHCRPVYDAFPINGYLSPGQILPYSASSGCYWSRCSFCPEQAEDNPYIPMSAGRVLEHLKVLTLKTKPYLLHLLDNAISPALLKKLALDPPGIPWYGFARISSLLTDSDFCRALKKSGCVLLKLGLESGDQGVLDTMGKGIDLTTASRVLKTLKKAGIATYVYLLFGTPSETLSEARNTLTFVARHNDEIGFLNLALFNMPVCSPEVSDYKTNLFYEGDLSLYTDFQHPAGWGRNEVRNFLDTEFRKHQAISSIVRRDPPIFTSNHAPFFVIRHR